MKTSLLLCCLLLPVQTALGQELEEPRSMLDTTILRFVGTGDIQTALSDGEDIEANTGLGVSFTRFWKEQPKFLLRNFKLDLVINVASTADTLQTQLVDGRVINERDLGYFILSPTNARQATALNIKTYFNTRDHNLFGTSYVDGIDVKVAASNRVWSLGTEQAAVTAILVRVGLFHDTVPKRIRERNQYSITIGAGYSYRGVLGDLGLDENRDLRERLLDSDRKHYHGAELTFGIKLNNIQAEASISKLSGEDVPGLSGIQFVTSIRFEGGFGLSLN